MVHRARLVAVVSLAGLALAAQAHAAEPTVILFESYSDARPIGMSRYVAEIVSGLNMPGLLTGDGLRSRLEGSFSRPASKATADDLQALVARASDGANAYAASNFNVAVSQLSQVVESLAREPAALVAQAKLRQTRKDALLTLAMSLAKLRRDAEARAVLAEAVRSYPDLEFSDMVHPPNIVHMGKSVQKERASHPRTTLVIETNPPGKKVFVNEQPVGSTPKTLTGIAAGTYRVYFPGMGANGRGSYRTVDVPADKPTRLLVSSEIEEHLEMEEYVGLRFSSAMQQHEAEVPIACAVAKSIGADKPDDEIIVITRQRSPSAEAELMGAIYDVKGHRKWGVILPLAPNPPDDAALARFAKSLRTKRQVEGVKVAPIEEKPPAAPEVGQLAPSASPPPEPSPRSRVSREGYQMPRSLKLLLGTSLGLAAALTGAWLGTYFAFDCSGPIGADGSDQGHSCGPGTAGRWLDAGFFSLAIGGWAIGASALAITLAEYAMSRKRGRPGLISLGASSGTPSLAIHF